MLRLEERSVGNCKRSVACVCSGSKTKNHLMYFNCVEKSNNRTAAVCGWTGRCEHGYREDSRNSGGNADTQGGETHRPHHKGGNRARLCERKKNDRTPGGKLGEHQMKIKARTERRISGRGGVKKQDRRHIKLAKRKLKPSVKRALTVPSVRTKQKGGET